MLRDRARVIAQTETTRVFAESRRLLFKQAGLKRIRWRTANDELVCPICAPLNGKTGRLDGVNHPREGRSYLPPAHVNCRCWFVEDVTELEELAGLERPPRPPRPGPPGARQPRAIPRRRRPEQINKVRVPWVPAMTLEEAAMWADGSLLAGYPLPQDLPYYLADVDPDISGLLTGTIDSSYPLDGLAKAGADDPYIYSFSHNDQVGEVLAQVKVKNPLVVSTEDFQSDEFASLLAKYGQQGKNLMDALEENGFDSLIFVSPDDNTLLSVVVSKGEQFTYLITDEGKSIKTGTSYGGKTWISKSVRLQPNYQPGLELDQVPPAVPPKADVPRAKPPRQGEQVTVAADDNVPPRQVRRRLATSEEALPAEPGPYATLEEAQGGPYQEVLESLGIDHDLIRQADLHSPGENSPWGPKAPGRKTSYGIVLVDSHGRLLVREPTDHFGGYTWTFAKGTPDPGEHPLDVALREVREETGFDAQVIGLLPGKYSSDDSDTFFFVARVKDFDAKAIDWETASTRWVDPTEALRLVRQSKNASGAKRDKAVVAGAYNYFVLHIKNGAKPLVHTEQVEWLRQVAGLAGGGPVAPEKPPVDPANLRRIKGLGGSHAVYLMEAEDGSKWVWKPQERWRAQVDRTAYEIAVALGHEIPETYEIGRASCRERV